MTKKADHGRALLSAALLSSGWTQDKWGHWQQTLTRHFVNGTTRELLYRVKVQDVSVRIEVGPSPWMRVAGGYFADVVPHESGGVQLGNYVIGGDRKLVRLPKVKESVA